MKRLKIILGFLLLYGTGKEYVNASRQLGSLYDIGIIIPIVLLLFLCTWLIGSGFSKTKLKFKTLKFLKYFGFSFLIFVIVAFFSLMSYVIPTNFKTINGVKIPINKCIDGSVRMIPKENEREDYCICLAEKITSDSQLKEKYIKDLEMGEFDKIIKDLNDTDKIIELGIESCFTSLEMQWTNTLANSMKRNWKKQFEGTEFEESNDVDKYCDCLIEEYRKFPLTKIMEVGFNESEEAMAIDEKCTKESFRNE
ncbi:hypothetical protein Q4Q39_06985 [Flavivirga amylovorans]|uniref:Uncharacterized protein n=1 Tax=Flavivirga amylovorans TaxID=870486 RepID=A0ABT8WZM9_9FLAO|nr:hypothetical protein [Flavivirga amylovorans]MDO5987136.1 hypothetical protein [Flavivirga amylovorans]